jgi:SAM-dependent methyltransferase
MSIRLVIGLFLIFVILVFFLYYKKGISVFRPFDYKSYWNNRYLCNGNSGAGSFGKSGEFKAEVINNFLQQHPEIETVIDVGCGDGEQLKKLQYKKYLGMDVSPKAIELCIQKFKLDETKSFGV